MPHQSATYRAISELELMDLEAIRLILSGSSVIDWHRLEFTNAEVLQTFLAVQEYDPNEPSSVARGEAIKQAAIGYLRRNFDFPIPKPIAEADLPELLQVASGQGHRQLCACTILKVMHIIHHLEARELLYMIPVSDQDVFMWVEQKVSRVVGGMLSRGLPVAEFIGGRKNKDSLYSKLLSKRETHAAQIYDKLRFRIVTRSPDDVIPTLAYLMRTLVPFNYVVPGQSTNTMFRLRTYLDQFPNMTQRMQGLQSLADDDDRLLVDNQFSAPSYRVVHFVVDLPVRVPREVLDISPPAAWSLGHVVFAQAEFQVVDRLTDQANETGEANHDAYKTRQRQAIMRRLKVGAQLRKELKAVEELLSGETPIPPDTQANLPAKDVTKNQSKSKPPRGRK